MATQTGADHSGADHDASQGRGQGRGDAAKPEWALSGRERRAKARAEAGLPPRRRRGWIVVAALLGLLLLGAGWYRNGGAEALAAMRAERAGEAAQADAQAADATPAADPDRVVQVMQVLPSELTEVTPLRLRETVKATGSLSPSRLAEISAEVSARVTEVLVRPGDRVKQGDLLVQLDVESLANQLDQQKATAEATRAQLRLARTQLERTRSLLGRGLTPESELDSGQANVDQLAASLAAQEKAVANAEENLKHARITAPFTGVISARSVDPGAYVATGSSLLTLVDLSTLEYEAAVPVRYATQLAPGQTVELSVEGYAGQDFAGAVDRISPVAIEGTRVLPVYVLIANPFDLLRGGMFASGRIVLDQKEDALGIPADALRQDDAGSFVLKRDGDHVIRQPVEVARSWEGGRMVEIATGLAPGDVIVSQQLEQLRPGTQILVVGD